MAVPIFVVDAFTDRAFAGNQAGVCLLPKDARLDPSWAQKVAAEMRHAETAFVQARPDGSFGLRWFTPAREVPLCGHATLASAHVLWERGVAPKGKPIQFETKSGRLTCTPAAGGGITLDFPTDPPVAGTPPTGALAALGLEGVATAVFDGKALDNVMVVLPDEAAVRAVRPDFAALGRASGSKAFIVTAAAGDGDGYVCRYFAPAWGIDEDPATGSIQCTLGPYWAQRLGQKEVRCRQLSARGAEMRVRPDGPRTSITGKGVLVLAGELLA